MIILSPCGPYYPAPMRIWVEETYVRAVRGGIGQAKAAGNYAASLLAATLAKEKGYDQVLWTDATEHRYVQEIGTMNVVFIIGNRAITPDLESGTILAGVTRDTAITLLREQGLEVEERPLSIDEIIAAHHAGTLREVFGTGTAATVSYIKELRYRDFSIHLDPSGFSVATGLKNKLTAIREGREADVHGWLYRV
jgi:branched-chain amino acid aminotransferase